MAEIVEEETIINNDCNINRNPRFINGQNSIIWDHLHHAQLWNNR